MADEDEGHVHEHYEAETTEEQEASTALEEEAQSALAALQDARRTLRDGREKQSMMRRNRNFFPGSSGAGRSGNEKPPFKCFRCGGPHLRRDCPKEVADPRPKQANFIFSATEDYGMAAAPEPRCGTAAQECWAAEVVKMPGDSQEEANYLSLEEIVRQGKAVVDGGATSTLGSGEALQQIARLKWEQEGRGGIEIHPEDQPSFRFGNNGRTTCMSTALLD